MKKQHIILLIITLTLVAFSVYSLTAINQVYKIDFEWYSEYYQSFSDDSRITNDEKWTLNKYPSEMQMGIFPNKNSFINKQKQDLNKTLNSISFDFQNDLLLYCSLGSVNSPEYRIKVVDIAQRGNVVEIKLSLNSPDKLEKQESFNEVMYLPIDIIKIKKSAFTIKGKLFFIFKNQEGNIISEKSCVV